MAHYDAEIRVKTKVDNSELLKMEAVMEAAQKKAGGLQDAVGKVGVDKAAAKEAGQAADSMGELSGKAKEAAAATERLNASLGKMRIHMADGAVYDGNLNVIKEAVKDTAELAQEQKSLGDISHQSAESMKILGEETRAVNEAVRGTAQAVEAYDPLKAMTPAQNMLAFIKKSFQDIPVMFGGIADDFTAESQQMEREWDNLSNRAAAYKQTLKEMEMEDKGFGNAEYDEAYIQWREAEQAVKNYKKQLFDTKMKQEDVGAGLKRISDESKKAFSTMHSGAKKSNNLLKTMASRFKGIMLSLLIFNWISKGFNAMIAGMKKGFENLAGYSIDYVNSIQSLKNAMSTLGNSFAAAFSPIVQMVIPWLTSLINAISTAMAYVAQFIAILGGKSTYTRAKQVQDSYNKSLGGTASAAKKAYGALAKFDDLDVLQQKEDASESGGGAGGAVGDMFEEVPVDSKFKDWLDGILEKLKPLTDYLKELGQEFMGGFWDGLGDYGYRLDIIKKGLQQIKDALIDIWTDPAVLAAADKWLRSVMYMLGSLVGSVASIALTIAAAFIGGLGDYMEKNVGRIKKFLISAFNISTEINYLLADLFQSIAYIFEAFASENGIRFMSALIGSIADASMGLIELALRLGRDFLEMLILPITENKDAFRTALEGMIGAAATLLEGLKTSIDNVFDNLLSIYDVKIKPFFDSIANGLSQIVGAFLDAWNGNIIPMLERVGAKFSEVLTGYISPFINSVIEFVGNLATILQAFWESFLMPLVEWVVTYAVPVISAIIEVLVNVVIIAVESILAILTEMMSIINDVLIPIWQTAWEFAGNLFNIFFTLLNDISSAIKDLISGLFKSVKLFVEGDWKGAWENAKKIFEAFRVKVSGIVDTVRGLLEGFFEWVSSMISSILEGLNSIGSAVSGAFSKVGSFVGGFFSGGRAAAPAPAAMSVAGYSLPEIPALASGSVIRGGNPFLAWLGDQPSGQTNVEAPLSTIRQALREELSGTGFGGGQLKVVLQVNGSDLAQATLDDFLSEMGRQGLDVEVLGVT